MFFFTSCLGSNASKWCLILNINIYWRLISEWCRRIQNECLLCVCLYSVLLWYFIISQRRFEFWTISQPLWSLIADLVAIYTRKPKFFPWNEMYRNDFLSKQAALRCRLWMCVFFRFQLSKRCFSFRYASSIEHFVKHLLKQSSPYFFFHSYWGIWEFKIDSLECRREGEKKRGSTKGEKNNIKIHTHSIVYVCIFMLLACRKRFQSTLNVCFFLKKKIFLLNAKSIKANHTAFACRHYARERTILLSRNGVWIVYGSFSVSWTGNTILAHAWVYLSLVMWLC